MAAKYAIYGSFVKDRRDVLRRSERQSHLLGQSRFVFGKLNREESFTASSGKPSLNLLSS